MPMDDFLQKAIAKRRQEAEEQQAIIPLEKMQEMASALSNRYRPSLVETILKRWASEPSMNIIAEVKKASPSAGVIMEDYDPAKIAQLYVLGGAIGISVLTEPNFFLGSAEDLKTVRQAVNLPILRKDFLSVPYQIYESAVIGADVVLLIAAALPFSELRNLYLIAIAIGLEVIIEIHSLEELEMMLPLNQAIIGVNNRDLRTLTTSLETSLEIAEHLPPDRIAISESGIKTKSDLELLQSAGYKGFLIGETLLRSPDIERSLKNLVQPRTRIPLPQS